MPMPPATLTSLTATGDVVTGPGAPTVLMMGLPASCLGDAVAGPMCVGAITVSPAPTVLIMGRPAAALTGTAAGSNPAALGAPASPPLMVTTPVTVLVG
ncbi:MAG: PAAR domain-containing protein [Planctomycetes bacterium]|nr:PAAR domain-containing protein [Planctomycetota bacterium]